MISGQPPSRADACCISSIPAPSESPCHALLVMKNVLGDFVLVGRAGDSDRNLRTRVVLFEKRDKRLQQHRFNPGSGMGYVRLHSNIAEHMDLAIVKVEGSVDVHVRSRHLEVETLRRNNAVAYLRPS